jgi:glyoxylase-like metal-dependent hydrolase (beta-lactamase superfamily II)
MADTLVSTIDLNFQGRPQAIASYLIRHSGGVVLVESGPGSTLEKLRSGLADLGYSPRDVTHVLLTHIHLDHAGAAGWLARAGAEIIVHPVGAPHMLQPEKLLASAARIYGDRMQSLWGEFLPVPEDRLRVVHDGEEIRVGALRFRAIDTPGHAEHHYAYAFEGLCFSGDVGGVRIPGYPYLRVPMPPPELHIERWYASVARLRQERLARIAPTHFGTYADPAWQLDAVERGLGDALAWLKRVMPADPPIEELRAAFTAWVETEGRQVGLSADAARAYELANPPGMSADGLQRYWKKVRNASAP